MPEKYFVIDGVATFLHHAGPTTLPGEPPDLSRGETILCLHGAGASGSFLRDLLVELASRHSPLAFDQPGHGRSGALDSLGSIERMADFTRALVEKLGLRSSVLLGHSMGGAVALRYALEHPKETRALVLLSTGARLPRAEALLESTRRVTEGKERRRFTREGFSPETPEEIVRRGWAEEAKTDPRALYGDLLACAEWDATGRLGEVAAPALVAVGEHEHPPLREQAELLGERMPRARLRVIPGAGHALPLERPRELAAAVMEFLEDSLP